MSDSTMRALERELRRQGRLVDFIVMVIEELKRGEDIARVHSAVTARLATPKPAAPFLLTTDDTAYVRLDPWGAATVTLTVPKGGGDFICQEIRANSSGPVTWQLFDPSRDRYITSGETDFRLMPELPISQFPLLYVRESTSLRLTLSSQHHEEQDVSFLLLGRLIPVTMRYQFSLWEAGHAELQAREDPGP